jgi:hypothetical protein
MNRGFNIGFGTIAATPGGDSLNESYSAAGLSALSSTPVCTWDDRKSFMYEDMKFASHFPSHSLRCHASKVQIVA